MNITDWIPIFRTGTHTDSNGNTRTWTEGDLDYIVNTYAPRYNEAPVVIGHPRGNSPAYGRIESVKREGGTLYAKLKDPVPDFIDMVRKGMFRKRSISLYPNGSIRHLGFLGAVPPAVKGLPDFSFSDSGGVTVEFTEKEEIAKWESKMQRLRTEHELVEQIADLVSDVLQKDKTLTYGKAFKKVIDENPKILKGLEEIESYQMRKKILSMGLDEMLEMLTKLKNEEKKDISYSQAFSEVQVQYPGLIQEYIGEIRG